MSYTDVTKVQARLSLSGRTLTNEEKNYLQIIGIPAVDAYISKETGVMFGNNVSTEVYVSGEHSSMLVLPTMSEVTAVASVDGDNVTNIPDYVKYPRNKSFVYALRSTGGQWSEGFENYKVTGKLGYVDVPGDITSVATELAINSLNQDKQSEYKSEKVGDWQVVYNEADNTITDESRSVLLSYRRLSRSI